MPNPKLTATMRNVNIPLPPQLVNAANIRAKDTVYLTSDKPGSIRAQKTAPTDALRCVELNNPAVLPIGKSVQEAAGIAVGDICQFDEVSADGTIVLSRLDRATARRPEFNGVDATGAPTPPGWMVQAFSGLPDQAAYLRSGAKTAQQLSEIARQHGRPMENQSAVVDFGCGAGRVIRHLPAFTDAQLIGCDLHSEAIHWCFQHLPLVRFFQGTELPPTPIADNSIDILYAISVLTHLDEEHQNAWLSEWNRIMKSGGIVVATFNGDDFIEKNLSHEPEYQMNIRNQWQQQSGFAFVTSDGWKGVFPEYYQTAYHTVDYVREKWSEYFEIVETLASGQFANRQNAAIMIKR